MSLSFQEMIRPDSELPLGGDAGLLEKLKRLRSCRLPNLRVCQVVGTKVCLRSCDPFGLDKQGADELMQLGLRTIIDLRSDHERSEGADAPIYSHVRVLHWSPDGSFQEEATPGAPESVPEGDPVPTVYRVDCLHSPQPQLRRFLRRDNRDPSRLCVPDVSAYLLPASGCRPASQLLRDALDCFPTAVAAAFRVLARPGAYPALLASLDGQRVAALVSCLMQLLLGEDASIIADMHAASETEYGLSRGLYPAEEQRARVKEARTSMLELVEYIAENYRSAENYLLRAGLSQQEIRQLKTT